MKKKKINFNEEQYLDVARIGRIFNYPRVKL